MLCCLFMDRGDARGTLFPTRRSSDLPSPGLATQTVQFVPVRDPVPPMGAPVVGSLPAMLGNVYAPSYGAGCTWFQLQPAPDRKSTRLNSSHTVISYAVLCLKKKRRSR